MTTNKAIEQYLKRYAEPEANLSNGSLEGIRFQRSLVIPAYDESPDFFARLQTSSLAKGLLLILVVNRPDSIEQCPANRRLIDHVEQTLHPQWQGDKLTLCTDKTRHFGTLLVDRDTTPIPHKQGVGLARKIGCDIATRLINAKAIQSNWIHSTDADAILNEDYFSAEALPNSCAAATYAFRHQAGDDAIAKATALYEQTLHDYVDGLKTANSPYSFHTIGSVLAFDYQAYCQARGFPKRSGGEDFYLLNKLRKLGDVAQLDCEVVLQPRVSHRVPFGTGPATAKILQQLDSGLSITTYNPKIFQQLQSLLLTATNTISNGEDLKSALQTLTPETREALNTLNIDACLKHLQQHKAPQQKLKHFHDWLDGFRTLKFVRHLQTHHFANIPIDTDVKKPDH